MVFYKKATGNVDVCLCPDLYVGVWTGAGVLLGLRAFIQAGEKDFKGIVCVTKGQCFVYFLFIQLPGAQICTRDVTSHTAIVITRRFLLEGICNWRAGVTHILRTYYHFVETNQKDLHFLSLSALSLFVTYCTKKHTIDVKTEQSARLAC